MHFKTSTFASAAVAFAAAISNVSAAALDIFVPPITSPVSRTVWVIGKQVNVTWDTSNAPAVITGGSGVLLRKGGVPTTDPGFLVQGFDLRDGFVEITVPSVEPANDYAITLFGDSGNISDDFTIAAA